MNSKDKLSFSETLTFIFLTNDNINKFINECDFTIDYKTLDIIRTILDKMPNSINKIVENAKQILQDGKIDFKDIPSLLLLITNLYTTDFKTIIANYVLTSNEIVNFVKIMLKLVIYLNFINLNNSHINKNDIYILIDTSGELLNLVIPNQTINFSCCSNMF